MVAPSIALAFALLLSPMVSHAATIEAGRSLNITVSPTDNAYLAASDIRINAPLPEDLLGAGGSIRVLAPIGGDVSLIGGTIDISAPVGGDVRAAGGHVTATSDVEGDFVVFGSFVRSTGQPDEVSVAGGTVEIVGGARGPVTVYGGTVLLSGVFEDKVHVAASDRIVVADGTIIRGALEYNAPQEAMIPDSALVEGGVRYVGSASFLPSVEEAQAFAVAGVGVFLLVRLVAGMLAAGLLAGLFPELVRRLRGRVLGRSADGFVLSAVVGLTALILTPILVLFLLISFVGMGLAALIGALYVLMLMLAHLFAAVLIGNMLARLLLKREEVAWHDGALGMLVLYIIGMVPVLGFLVSLVLTAATLGALCTVSYLFAFKKESDA